MNDEMIGQPWILGPLLGHCANLVRGRMDARLSHSEVTPVQTHVLLYLYHRGGQAPQREVTEHLRVKPSTVNGILDRMEEKGLVERSVSGSDARRRLITLTGKGREEQAFFQQVFTETEDLIARGLTDQERLTFYDLLSRVIANLKEDQHT